ncbi:biopolymer transporter ExbD [Ahniella affigens]|uniref:Biopolymer transporter ExbD n=1 Tax=Ahniella affigens TaxID=2021234 RepID=A0A2P1PWI1_9GAMM|nr:biopolymer transporter ExbD [Ahniella affigens]AVP99196.1 biopolymer transporter ExbD [Ahniella affigens]
MAFSSNNDSGGVMAEINVTPLVDVMLVLLIIFMITTPLMTDKVKIELPDKSMLEKPKEEPARIALAVKSNGELYFNDQPVMRQTLEQQLRIEARREPQPLLEIRADRTTEYRVLSDIMGIAKTSGMKKIGFATHPEK